MIIRKPTIKQKIESLNEHSGKKKYEWDGKGGRGEEYGENLWNALSKDNEGSSSQYCGVFERWYQDEAYALIEDEEQRKERDAERKGEHVSAYTDDEWTQDCYDTANFYWEDISNGNCFDKEKDNEVAEYFNIDFEITEWNCDNTDCINTEEVVAVCSCGYPLSKLEMWHGKKTDSYQYECPYCGEDTRSKAEKVLDGI